MGNLWDPDSGILTARMMGSTHTALITFSGSHIPRWVNYRGVMVRCAPHKPRAQFCTVCSGLGHCADVCPNTELIKTNRAPVPWAALTAAGTTKPEILAAKSERLQTAPSVKRSTPVVHVSVFLPKISKKRYNRGIRCRLVHLNCETSPKQKGKPSQEQQCVPEPLRDPPPLTQWTSWPGRLNLTGYSETPFLGKSTKQPFLNSCCPKPNNQPTALKPP
ncbi:hypothetical protein HPB49_017065 [Dermacentor silvarum]|uniref:Uncharacterized protein n=1 Tax=Dermacentor silvarum TaxID=543639 RepID=A0ACB8DQC8_DERSI|nr:hypothetical protein HPB49_017065 [Dermacentor silvarum]